MARNSQKDRKKNRPNNMPSHANRNVITASSPPKVALDVAIAERFAQLDLSSSSGGPFSRLPNELVESILARVDMQKLIQLQVVCKKWHAVVRLVGDKKKSLRLILRSSDCDYGLYCRIMITDYIVEDLKKRSFGQIDLSTFTTIKLKSYPSLKSYLVNLFPNIESIAMDMPLSNIFTFLSQLHPNKLTTLSISFLQYSSDETLVKLLTLINSFVSLKRLDIKTNLNRQISLLGPTLARLEQFSYSSYEPSLVDLFGPNCSRVSLIGFFGNINFSQWHSNNAQWLATVTHLELKNVHMEEQHIDSLIVHAVSLKVLRFEANQHDRGSPIRMTPQMIGRLSKLKHLTEIEMNRIIFELPQLYQARENLQLVPLVSLRVCTLSIQKLVRFPRMSQDEGTFLFATVLSAIFPNVEHLNIDISSYYFQDLQGILYYLGKFTKLQKHSFKEGKY